MRAQKSVFEHKTCFLFRQDTKIRRVQRHTWGVVGTLVIALFQIFSRF